MSDAQTIFAAFAGSMANMGKDSTAVNGVLVQLSQAMGKATEGTGEAGLMSWLRNLGKS